MTALIRWSPSEAGGRDTPPGPQYRTVARFAAQRQPADQAWSLIVQNRWFSPSGEVSVADVRFLAEAAPQELLMPGVRFELLEGERVVAIGMLVAAQRTLDEIGKLAEAI